MIAEHAMLQKKMHYILHRSLVDARNLALARDHQKIFDLADNIRDPAVALMEQWEDEHWRSRALDPSTLPG